MMMPELKMLANGFALQHAQGKDVQKSISQLHTDMMALYYTGQLGELAQTITNEYEEGVYTNSEVNLSDEKNSFLSKQKLSPDAQARIEKAKKRRQQYREEQAELVAKYHLPYKIPDRDTQVIVYSHNMKSSKSSGSSGTRSKPKFHNLDRGISWRDADFFYVNAHTAGVEYGHVGLVIDTSKHYKTVVDAMPTDDHRSIKRHYGITDYLNDDHGWTEMEAYHAWVLDMYDPYHLHEEQKKVVQYANRRVGHKVEYSVAHGKRNQKNTYCSAFVWMAYNYATGLDFDHSGGWFIWPRDLTDSIYTTMFDSREAY